MNRSDVVRKVAEKTGLTQKQAGEAVTAFMETVMAGAVKEDVAFVGFGTFGVKERPARTGRNPRTGEEMTIPASKVPFFKPGKTFKKKANA